MKFKRNYGYIFIYMKYYLLAVFSALFIFACTDEPTGKVSGGYDYSTPNVSSDSCNGIPYEPQEKFCFEDEIYSLCGGEEYNPKAFECVENKIFPVCSGTPYDSTKSFCYENTVYFKCNGNKYFPSVEDCFNNKLYPICGTNRTPYDSMAGFCFEGTIYSKCNGEKYFPNLEFCFESVVYSKCKDKSYNPSKEFCFENAIYSKCNGSDYNVTKELCFNSIKTRCPNSSYDDEFCEDKNGISISYRICGNKEYKTDSTFCFNDEIYQKCGGTNGKNYDPYKEFCYNNDYYPRCGGNMYSPINDFCFGDKVYLKCGNETYNPKESFCSKGVILPLCNGAEVPDGHFCSNDFKVLPKCNGNIYNTITEICYKNDIYVVCPNGEFTMTNCTSGTKYSLCGSERYETAKEFCYGNMTFPKCGINMSIDYDPSKEFCGEDKNIYDLCKVQTGVNDFGVPIYSFQRYNTNSQICDVGKNKIEDKYFSQQCGNYDNTIYFCCFGNIYPINGQYFCYPDQPTKDKPQQLYPKCGTQLPYYDPFEQGCFEGQLYPKCLSNNGNARGVCVDSDDKGPFKRCKQLGNGKNYVIDPLPGMTCQNTGAITGTNYGYPVAQIGEQIWLAKDLDVAVNKLYDWVEAMDTADASCYKKNCSFGAKLPRKGPCPTGFYLPEDKDWQKLIDYAGGASIAGGRLKSTDGWSYNGNGMDDYGFSAKPNGYYNGIVSLNSDVGSRSMWWSLTQHPSNGDYASYWTIISSDTEVRNSHQDKELHKAYVRCLHY
jgi:uncharacterized protein (TIGR02145 family)